MGQQHPSTTVPLEPQFVQSFSTSLTAYPASTPCSISSQNSDHLWAITLPQEKHRTGIIIQIQWIIMLISNQLWLWGYELLNHFVLEYNWGLLQIVMNSQQKDKWPFYPPYDTQIVINEESKAYRDPKDTQKKSKFCPVCDFPINNLVILHPCNHYECEECYKSKNRICQICNSVVTRMRRVEWGEEFYSCDIECFKVFESQERLKKHYKCHEELGTI